MTFNELRSSKHAQSAHFLLIGNPVKHSLSPLMHNAAAEYYGMDIRYLAVELQPSELGSLAAYLNNEHLKGVNITIPYKQMMLNYVDELSSGCREIGAINTIKKNKNRLIGYNTDVSGFLKPLEPFRDEIENARAIIFGTGGASKAIAHGLQQLNTGELIVVSRQPHQQKNSRRGDNLTFCSYDAWPSYANETTLIVNATPLGMSPDTQTSPVQADQVEHLKHKICYDIVYKPLKTTFLKMAEEVNARTIGGLEMLIHQGSSSFELWTGNPFPIDYIRDILNDHLAHED